MTPPLFRSLDSAAMAKDTHKDNWVGWLEEYDGPGYYGRSRWDRDSRFVYQHLCCGPMIVWLNEAAGEDPALIKRTIREMQRDGLWQ
jgi:hypothetical protein